jgi:hypothetical protein
MCRLQLRANDGDDGLMTLTDVWLSVYSTFQDNAFDYVGAPFYNDNDGTIQLWNGSKMVTYAEVPF